MLFVDDSFIFMEVYMASCNKLKEFLERYEKAYGKKVNLDKFVVF